jgi:hypothetical protein
MSEPHAVEQEQEAPTMREAATGPLLPRWFSVPFYVVFGLFCAFSLVYIVRSYIVQNSLVKAMAVLNGDTVQPAVGLDSPQGEQALVALKSHPVQAILYLNQQMLQNEEDDPRMARAMALRKAVTWSQVAAERDMIDTILAHMRPDGSLDPDFELSSEMQKALEELVARRRADTELTYAEDLITDALEWVVKGSGTKPKGTERRQLAALETFYRKKVFQGSEMGALRELMRQWEQSSEPVAQKAAGQFALMLEGKQAELSAEEQALCTAGAAEWEGRYRDGIVYIAQAARQLAAEIAERGLFLDHPHIYQYCSLLDHRFPQAREDVAAGIWLLRHSQFTVRFLSYFATKTAVNPFMAVETLRMTREEREREMRKLNNVRMREAVVLLGRIGVDYIEHPEQYKLAVADPNDFMRKTIVSALTEVEDEPVIADVVAEALQNIQRADQSRSGGSLLTAGPRAEL